MHAIGSGLACVPASGSKAGEGGHASVGPLPVVSGDAAGEDDDPAPAALALAGA